ncbi:MAG: zincin-like metallopeptidase domain-containing protein [Rhizomicrobium sp.]
MPYHGVNIVGLWAQAANRGFMSGYWASYQQWRKLGAQVRGGERGSLIIFYKRLGQDADGVADAADAPRFVIRASHVFNAAQVDGWEHPLLKRPSLVETNAQIEAFVGATKAEVRHGSRAPTTVARATTSQCQRHNNSSARRPAQQQKPTMPSCFTNSRIGTGASHRINRVFGKRFGDHEYACEELVAELGAAFLCSAFGIVNQPRPDHAAYIAKWLEISRSRQSRDLQSRKHGAGRGGISAQYRSFKSELTVLAVLVAPRPSRGVFPCKGQVACGPAACAAPEKPENESCGSCNWKSVIVHCPLSGLRYIFTEAVPSPANCAPFTNGFIV